MANEKAHDHGRPEPVHTAELEALTEQEQAEYDDWLRTEVQAAIDDPRPSITNEEVERDFSSIRAMLQKRIESKQS